MSMTVERAIEVLEYSRGYEGMNFGAPKIALEMAISALEEVQQLHAIGTVEEFKELKEKATAKKAIPIDYEKYTEVVKNAKLLRGAYWCPNCGHVVKSGDYCNDCGQKLDWSEGKE